MSTLSFLYFHRWELAAYFPLASASTILYRSRRESLFDKEWREASRTSGRSIGATHTCVAHPSNISQVSFTWRTEVKVSLSKWSPRRSRQLHPSRGEPKLQVYGKFQCKILPFFRFLAQTFVIAIGRRLTQGTPSISAPTAFILSIAEGEMGVFRRFMSFVVCGVGDDCRRRCDLFRRTQWKQILLSYMSAKTVPPQPPFLCFPFRMKSFRSVRMILIRYTVRYHVLVSVAHRFRVCGEIWTQLLGALKVLIRILTDRHFYTP